jgi:thiamine biosynthesis lipoprotein
MKQSVFLLLSLVIAATAPALDRFGKTEKHMGADFTVKLFARDEEEARAGFREAFAIIAEYDRLLSDYNAESELMQLCAKSPTREPVAVSPQLFNVLSQAQAMSEKTDGAFDATVGPLTRLWRRARRQRELPTEEERIAALAAVGWKNVVLEAERRVSLKKPKMQLDLGGIAPGAAAQQALVRLKEMGIASALVDASGDVSLGDAPPGEKGWKIGIAPLRANSPPEYFLTLANCAVATSGDAFRGVTIDGVRYSHIVDPATGLGVKHRSSVTVIAADGGTADALATAMSVAGPKRGLELLKNFPGAEVRFVTEDDEGEVHVVTSENFPPSQR